MKSMRLNWSFIIEIFSLVFFHCMEKEEAAPSIANFNFTRSLNSSSNNESNFRSSWEVVNDTICNNIVDCPTNIKMTGSLEENMTSSLPILKHGLRMTDVARSKRNSRYGSSWSKSQLTYKIISYPKKLTEKDVDSEFKRAFEVWSKWANLKFDHVITGPVDIEIEFIHGEHGKDCEPFSENSSFLAHAFFPHSGGDIHFDSAPEWTINKSHSEIDIFQVAVHEVGHSLGLDHVDHKSSVMYPNAKLYNPNFDLSSEDIRRIQAMYGPNSHILADICNDEVKIDAILAIQGGLEADRFLFSGKYYWHLESGKLVRIMINGKENMWKELPENIDAAFLYGVDVYFIKDGLVWKYNGSELEKNYPKKFNLEFPGVSQFYNDSTHPIDAALSIQDGEIIFFIKNKALLYSMKNKTVIQHPRSLINDGNELNDVDAVYMFNKWQIYIITDDKLYMLKPKALTEQSKDLTLDHPSFPKLVKSSLLDCGE